MAAIRTPSQLVVLLLASILCNQAWSQNAEYATAQHGEFLRNWLILGPIVLHTGEDEPDRSQLKESGFDADLLKHDGSETNVTPKAGEESGELGKWKLYESDDEAIDLSEAMELKSWAAAYAAATISSEEASDVVLGIGSDDDIKVWLNGELVHENWVGRPIGLDDDLVAVKLRKGENRLLLKVLNAEGDWAFALRFLSQKNMTSQLVKAAASRNEEKLKDLLAAGADINARSKHGLTAYLAAKIKGNDKIARMLQVLGANTDVEFDPTKLIESILVENTSAGKPGAAVLISKGNEILYSRCAGAASVEHGVAITPETKFRIGSVTKQFTAAAILKLQEDGKLNVNDKLSKFIPDFPRGDEVTLHHLLTHTSGLKNYTSKPDFYETVASRVEVADMVEAFKKDEFDFDPGEKFAYCNTGYFLLSYIVQQVSGMSYDEYLKTTFFQDLGMHDTGVHESTGVYKHEATGYSMEGKKVNKAIDWDMSRAGGAGNLYSTVNDLRIWNEAIFSGKILNEDSLKAAHTVNEVKESDGIQMPYGYGWMMDDFRGLNRISHSGGLQGFVSQLTRYPEHDVTIVALHNAFPSVPALAPGALVDAIAEAFLWQEMKARPKYILAKDVDPDIYDDYVGRYDYRGAIMTVVRDGNKLKAQLSGQPQLEIFPAGNDKFFWKVVDAQVEFIRDSAGKVTSVRHTQGIAKFVAPRAKEHKEVKLSEEILARYVGKYSYRGLGQLTVRRDGDQLLAQMKGQPEFKIFPESETEFFWRVVNAEIKFEVDDDGNVVKATHFQGGSEVAVKKIE